jgi:hypothetical protein
MNNLKTLLFLIYFVLSGIFTINAQDCWPVHDICINGNNGNISYITKTFGPNPTNDGKLEFNNGIDIYTGSGTNIYCVDGGAISIFSDTEKPYVQIGEFLYYGINLDDNFKNKSTATKGDLIGKSLASEIHLEHHGGYYNTKTNPLKSSSLCFNDLLDPPLEDIALSVYIKDNDKYIKQSSSTDKDKKLILFEGCYLGIKASDNAFYPSTGRIVPDKKIGIYSIKVEMTNSKGATFSHTIKFDDENDINNLKKIELVGDEYVLKNFSEFKPENFPDGKYSIIVAVNDIESSTEEKVTANNYFDDTVHPLSDVNSKGCTGDYTNFLTPAGKPISMNSANVTNLCFSKPSIPAKRGANDIFEGALLKFVYREEILSKPVEYEAVFDECDHSLFLGYYPVLMRYNTFEEDNFFIEDKIAANRRDEKNGYLVKMNTSEIIYSILPSDGNTAGIFMTDSDKANSWQVLKCQNFTTIWSGNYYVEGFIEAGDEIFQKLNSTGFTSAEKSRLATSIFIFARNLKNIYDGLPAEYKKQIDYPNFLKQYLNSVISVFNSVWKTSDEAFNFINQRNRLFRDFINDLQLDKWQLPEGLWNPALQTDYDNYAFFHNNFFGSDVVLAYNCGLVDGILSEITGFPQLLVFINSFVFDSNYRNSLLKAVNETSWEKLKISTKKEINELAKNYGQSPQTISYATGRVVITVFSCFVGIEQLSAIGKTGKLVSGTLDLLKKLSKDLTVDAASVLLKTARITKSAGLIDFDNYITKVARLLTNHADETSVKIVGELTEKVTDSEVLSQVISKIDDFGTDIVGIARQNDFLADLAIKTGTNLSILIGDNLDKLTGRLVDAWKVLNDAGTSLRTNLTALSKIDFLKTKKLTDIQLKNIGALNDIKAIEIAENFNLRSTTLNDNLDELITNTFNANSRAELATWSSQYGFNTDLVSQLEKLSLTSKLDQPESMLTFFNSQLTKRFENPGYVAQLNEAIKCLDAGSTIRIEGGADIIDLTNSKAYQFKAFTSSTLDKFQSNLQSAAKQFTTEQAPSGYDKIAKIKVLNSSNPTYTMNSDELRSVLQNYMDNNALNTTGDNLKALTEIQVENGNGLFRYTIENTLVLKIE